jgi:hypothetical protein
MVKAGSFFKTKDMSLSSTLSPTPVSGTSHHN